jgi:hypothetical protein
MVIAARIVAKCRKRRKEEVDPWESVAMLVVVCLGEMQNLIHFFGSSFMDRISILEDV